MQVGAFRIQAASTRISALLATTVLTAAFAPSVALAQQSEVQDEDIIVTGSQIARSGFDTPTPVTVVGIADFERVATPNIADTLNQLPALKASATPQSSTNLSKIAGANYLDLRGLTYLRTLVLVDGKRYMPSSPEGVININNLPQAVIGSVEVVTGGASAVYGSDAVAGVVNFVMKRDFEGIEVRGQTGLSDRFDRVRLLLIAAGWAFATMATIATLVSLGMITYWGLVIGGFCIGMAQSPSQPARYALVSELVVIDSDSTDDTASTEAMISETTTERLGRFGDFGGRWMPESLIAALDQVTDTFEKAKADPEFLEEFQRLSRDYANRPSLLTEAERFGAHAGCRGAGRLSPATGPRDRPEPAADRAGGAGRHRAGRDGSGRSAARWAPA